MQEQFYQLWENAPDSSAYNSGFYMCVKGGLDLHMLQAAVRMLFERQQVGRTQACGVLLFHVALHNIGWSPRFPGGTMQLCRIL